MTSSGALCHGEERSDEAIPSRGLEMASPPAAARHDRGPHTAARHDRGPHTAARHDRGPHTAARHDIPEALFSTAYDAGWASYRSRPYWDQRRVTRSWISGVMVMGRGQPRV
jgi:hypothetical protein